MLYRKYGKRIQDLIFATLIAVVFSPAVVLIGIFIRIKIGAPILFSQERPGLEGKPFTIYKIRTMNNARDEHGNLLPDAERLTPFGKFLRSTSLDELPELINVFKGEMSIVGPRPLLMRYLPRYSSEQACRHSVKPGITGWAQVNGRNAISWSERFVLDVWYTDNLSFCLDLEIIFLTLGAVISRKGINQPGRATMDEFMGDN